MLSEGELKKNKYKEKIYIYRVWKKRKTKYLTRNIKHCYSLDLNNSGFSIVRDEVIYVVSVPNIFARVLSECYFSARWRNRRIYLTNVINWNRKLANRNSFCEIEFEIVEMMNWIENVWIIFNPFPLTFIITLIFLAND